MITSLIFFFEANCKKPLNTLVFEENLEKHLLLYNPNFADLFFSVQITLINNSLFFIYGFEQKPSHHSFYSQNTINPISANKQPNKNSTTYNTIHLHEETKALITYQDRFNGLLANLSDAILLVDELNKILFCNSYFLNLFEIKYTSEELLDKDCVHVYNLVREAILHPDKFTYTIYHTLSHQLESSEEIFETINGKIIHNINHLIISNGKYIGFLMKFKDITEKRNHHKALVDQKNYYQKVLDVVPANFVLLDKEGKFTFVNKSAFKNEDVRKWVIGKTHREYGILRNLPEELIEKREKLINDAINQKIPSSMIDEYTKPDGTKEYLLRKIHPNLLENGEIDFIMVYGVDVTEQIESKKLAELQEKRISNLLEIIKDGVFRGNENGNINLYNESFLNILELKEQGHNKNINIFNELPLSQAEKLKLQVSELLSNGKPIIGTFLFKGISGKEKYLEYILILANKNEDAAFVGRISDITELINKEKNYNELLNKEKSLNYTKSNFIKISSHELRTPLAIIQTNAEILELLLHNKASGNNGIDPNKIIGRIIGEVSHMTDILNQLLLVSQIQDDSIQANFNFLNINNFIENIKSEKYSPYIDGRTLNLKIEDKIYSFKCDSHLLKHALINLIDNAFKFSLGKTPPVLKVFTDSNYLIFEIEDFGIGIPHQDSLLIDMMFSRASNVSHIQGTGLGLLVIKHAVEKHNGIIHYTSKLNEGTKFVVSLPK